MKPKPRLDVSLMPARQETDYSSEDVQGRLAGCLDQNEYGIKPIVSNRPQSWMEKFTDSCSEVSTFVMNGRPSEWCWLNKDNVKIYNAIIA